MSILCELLYDWVPPLRLFHTEHPAIHQLQFRFSYPDSDSQVVLLLNHCSHKLWHPGIADISLILGNNDLHHVFLSFKDPWRVVGFSVWSTFYLLLGQSGDFHAPNIQNRKLEVNYIIIFIIMLSIFAEKKKKLPGIWLGLQWICK